MDYCIWVEEPALEVHKVEMYNDDSSNQRLCGIYNYYSGHSCTISGEDQTIEA